MKIVVIIIAGAVVLALVWFGLLGGQINGIIYLGVERQACCQGVAKYSASHKYFTGRYCEMPDGSGDGREAVVDGVMGCVPTQTSAPTSAPAPAPAPTPAD